MTTTHDAEQTASGRQRPALFLDRDGVINVDRGFVAHRDSFVWQDGIFELVRKARARGFVPVVVTNQSGIGRGLYTSADYETLTAWMLARFEAEAAPIQRIYHCPFHPEAELPHYRAAHPWRKPAPGMLLAAAADLDLDLGRSIMIGDRWSDVGAAVAAGVAHVVLIGPRAREDDPAAPPGLVRLPDVAATVRWFSSLASGAAEPVTLGV